MIHGMMTTYDLIRKLTMLDPDGTCPIMLSVKTADPSTGQEREATGTIDELFVERMENEDRAIIITAIDG